MLPMAAAAAVGDVFLTATGSRAVLRAEHFAQMKDGAIFGNVGHFDVEIDVPALSRLSSSRPAPVRPHLQEYRLDDGRRLLLLTQGRLVNLAAAEGHPAAVMDLSFAGQALAAEWLLRVADSLTPDVYGIPADLDAEIAGLVLDAMGIHIDRAVDGALDSTLPDQRPREAG